MVLQDDAFVHSALQIHEVDPADSGNSDADREHLCNELIALLDGGVPGCVGEVLQRCDVLDRLHCIHRPVCTRRRALCRSPGLK